MIDVKQFDGFTPGPWKVSDLGDYYIESPSGYVIAKVSKLSAYKKAHKANVTLLASAPLLLAEVKRLQSVQGELVAALDAYVSGDPVAHTCVAGEHRPAHVARLNAARAALKLAKGE